MAGFDPSHAAESLTQYAADLEQQAQRFEQLKERMSTLSCTASTGDGRVQVTVDSNGVPTAITLGQATRNTEPAVLSAEIMACLRQAQGRLRVQIPEVVQATVGDHPAGAQLVTGLSERFPQPTAEPDPLLPQGASTSSPSVPAPPTAPTAESPASRPRTRTPDRNQVVTPDEPDDDDEYFNKKSWLV
ncbi:YbaB/EbfC family nucleoid-associated protein [Nocardia sp. NPDC048505]|uniref:YbaB/EbfC family nucleoid-associated protein n=1 Tax=unclassified Nocardia TaxID=2637762 RepID=UPI0033CEC86F